jgi:hypothetical protein
MDTEFSTHVEWTEIVEKIRAVAKVLRFDLREKTRDGTDISRWKSRRSHAAWEDFYASVLLVSVSRQVIETYGNTLLTTFFLA